MAIYDYERKASVPDPNSPERMAIVRAVSARTKKLEHVLKSSGFQLRHSDSHGDIASWGYTWRATFNSSEGGTLSVEFMPNAVD